MSEDPQTMSSLNVADLLREQGEDDESIQALSPTLNRLRDWPAPTPTPQDTLMLVERLKPLLPLHSSTPSTATSYVRQAQHEQSAHMQVADSLNQFLRIAVAQVGLLRPSFWLVSLAIVAVGALIVLSGLSNQQTNMLRALGPLLAVLSVSSIMRSRQLGVLELELSCPVSPLQLALARMVVVLGYDIGLGLVFSVVLSASGQGRGQIEEIDASLLALILHWLAPLLLVSGVALLLSLKLPPMVAGTIAYAAWLSMLVLALSEREQGFFTMLLSNGEALMLAIGAVLLAISVAGARLSVPALLSHD
jgi:hypothetical protein